MTKLFIHDKFMEQLLELPKQIQKKVLEFQKKFRANSKSAAIHLEPISNFKDSSLRTARIDDKYRAIIGVPETGTEYYLLWVDNHDEAMDWARNKLFNWNENTHTAQIFTAVNQEEIAEYQTSAEETSLFGQFSEDNLLAIGVPQQSLKLVQSLKNLDELDDVEKYLPSEAYERLFYLVDGLNIEILLAEIKEGKSSSENHEEQVMSSNNRRFFVEIDDDLIREMLDGELSKWQIFLHPSQRNLVEGGYTGPVKVTGGAGTGKTVVALHRAKFLSNLATSDTRKIAFVTYTNALTTNLNALAQRISIEPRKVLITNIDSLVKELALGYNLIAPSDRVLDFPNTKSSMELWEEVLELNLSEYDSDFLNAEYQNVILYHNVNSLEEYLRTSRIGRALPVTRKARMEIWRLVEAYLEAKKKGLFVDRYEVFNRVSTYLQSIEVKPFRHVIADELQDLSNVELRFLRALTEIGPNDLFLVGDNYQKIYDKKLNFTAAGISVRGKRSRQLRINYRTSEEIKRLAISAVKGLKYDDFDGEEERLNGYLSLFHGNPPKYELFKTKPEEIEAILAYIGEARSETISLDDIAIACRTKDAIKEIKTALHQRGIPYVDISAPGLSGNEGVRLSTFHSLKGLEFKVVILADVNNRTAPYRFGKFDALENVEKEHYIQRERSLLYVAMSRAIRELYITGTGRESELITI